MKTLIATLAFLACAATAYAVPVLQVGAPGASGEGTYANYSDYPNPSVPSEDDTAVTDGNLIYVGGAYKQDNKNTTYLNLGGMYTGGQDWGAVNSIYSLFNGHGAVLFATVPETSGNLKISLDNITFFNAFASGTTNIFPNNHAPLNLPGVRYLYFDIGNFEKNKEDVPNFDEEENMADPDPGAKRGEIKSIYLDVIGYSWVHFDVMALLTDQNKQGVIVVNDYNNPGSHDVTWKEGGGGQQDVVPEPGTIMLLGTGLIGLALYGRRRMK